MTNNASKGGILKQKNLHTHLAWDSESKECPLSGEVTARASYLQMLNDASLAFSGCPAIPKPGKTIRQGINFGRVAAG